MNRGEGSCYIIIGLHLQIDTVANMFDHVQMNVYYYTVTFFVVSRRSELGELT